VSSERAVAGHTPRSILEMAAAFQRSRVLLTAYELGLFSVLTDETKTSAEVAASLETDRRATDRLMNALVALGLLEKHGGQFSNTPAAAQFLVKGRPGYMAGLMHTVHLWDTWSTMTDAVRGGAARKRSRIDGGEGDWLRAFIAAMHYRARAQAPQIVAEIDLAGVSRLLDIGGGSGAFSMAFVRAGAGISAVVFDLPSVVHLTRSYVESEGFAAQIAVVPGDYLRNDLGSGFDLVFLSAIVHSNSDAQNRLLIRKAAAALEPGGRVVVVDWIMTDDRTEPVAGALFALNMLVGTEAGDTFTEAEIRSWMTDAGLSEIIRKDTPAGPGLMIGRKRAEA
jgi:SAM-dependent methyltransferase